MNIRRGLFSLIACAGFLAFVWSVSPAMAVSCVSCDQLFGPSSSNRYRQTIDQSTLKQCPDPTAIAQYTSCQREVDTDKASCGMECKSYQEDPCFGECESNYQGCLKGCVQTYGISANVCVDTLLDACHPACQAICTRSCDAEEKRVHNATQDAEEACKGVQFPSLTLTDQGPRPNSLLPELCKTRKQQLNDAQATLDRAEKKLADDKSQGAFLEHVLVNQKVGLGSLEEQYQFFVDDIDKQKTRMDEVGEKLSEVNARSNKAWVEAIAGTAGPFGALVEVGFLIGKYLSYQDDSMGHMFIRLMIDIVHETEILPIGPVGWVYDGVELQHLKNETHEVEKEFNQVRGWYEDALTALNGFKSRQEYATLMSLEAKIKATQQTITLIQIEMEGLEKEIPVMKHTRDIAKELNDTCIKDMIDEALDQARRAPCKKALLAEKAAQDAYDACKAKK